MYYNNKMCLWNSVSTMTFSVIIDQLAIDHDQILVFILYASNEFKGMTKVWI